MSYRGVGKSSVHENMCAKLENLVALPEIHAKCWRYNASPKTVRVRRLVLRMPTTISGVTGLLNICARILFIDEFAVENMCSQSKFETTLAPMDVAGQVMNGADLIAARWMNV